MRLSYILIERFESFPSTADFRRRLDFVRQCGYEGIELNMTQALFDQQDALESWLREAGLLLPSFLTGEAYNDGLCLSSADASVRRRTVERLSRYVDLAKRLHSLFVVGMLQGTARDEANSTLARERIIEGIGSVAVAAGKAQVQFVIEPVNHLQVGFHNSVQEVRDLIRAIGSPQIRPMADTIHMNIEESSMVQAILDCGPDLAHVHLCESNGGRFGTGHIDFGSVYKALEQIDYKGFCSVKVYRHLDFETAASSSFDYLQALENQTAAGANTR